MAGSNYMYELAEGNPGALSVVSRLDVDHLIALKQTELRGSMIWVAYKDICGEDMRVLRQAIEDRIIEEKVKQTPDWEYYHEKI